MERLRRATVLLTVAIVLTGLTWGTVEASDTTGSARRPDGPPSAGAAPVPADRVAQLVQGLGAGSAVGVEVVDRDSGRPVFELASDRPFHAASIVKLLIAADVITSSGGNPPEDVRAQVHQMLAASDDNIANALWDAGGGPAIVTRVAAQFGLTGTQPPNDPAQWGNTLITARDVVTSYLGIDTRLPEPGRSLVLDALAHASRQAADGWDQYFGIPTGLPDMPWAIKQGWMSSPDEVVLHTTGLVGDRSRYAVALLTSAPPDASDAALQAINAEAAALMPVIRPTGPAAPH
jgi:hypothetical protein